MEIVRRYPPNYSEIVEAIPQAAAPGVIFCYGDKIYAPGRGALTPALIAHEDVHRRQQLAVGGPGFWSRRYLTDIKWRYEQELAAHIAEYRHDAGEWASRQQRRQALSIIAKRLSSALYGRLVTLDEAKRLLQEANLCPSQ